MLNEDNKKEKRLLKLAIAMNVCFSLCWLPFAIFATIYRVAGKLPETGISVYLYEGITLMPAILNSLLNPFLYFKIMTKCKICNKPLKKRGKNETQVIELNIL